MNEKRKIEPDLDPDSPETRTRSDVAPKKTDSGVAARHISGLRPAVHLPPAKASVPPAPLTPEDLLEDGWDDEDDDSGPTLLDSQGSVPRQLVADARAVSDPIASDEEDDTNDEDEPETHEVTTLEPATREVPTREVTPSSSFDAEEAPTGEMPTMQNPLPALGDEDDDEFSHDDFPTRQTPHGLQQALLSYPIPSDSHRGLHETLERSTDGASDSAEPPSSAPLGPTIAHPVAPVSPLAPSIPSLVSSPSIPSFPSVAPISPLASSLAAPAPPSPDETAQMPNAPALPRLDELSQPPPPVERSSVSRISELSQLSQVSQVSQVSQISQASRSVMYPTPTSITGAPLPPASTVRFAFLRNLSPNNDPPLGKLVTVAAIAFFATLVLSAFVAWIVVLVRH